MSTPNSRQFKIAVLISGGGTTLKNLIEKIAAGRLPVAIRLVISSNPKAGGLKFAREADIPSLVIEQKNFPDQDAFSREIFGRCRAAVADLVVMGGFLKRFTIPDRFRQSRGQHPPGADPGLLRQGILRPSRPRGRAGIRRETERLHGPFRRQSIRPRTGDFAEGRAGARRRHARDACRPRVRGRVRGLSRGAATDRRRSSPDRIPPRANTAARIAMWHWHLASAGKDTGKMPVPLNPCPCQPIDFFSRISTIILANIAACWSLLIRIQPIFNLFGQGRLFLSTGKIQGFLGRGYGISRFDSYWHKPTPSGYMRRCNRA